MNENKLWFKAKNFGWGWYPVTWQGWVSTLIYVLFLVSEFSGIKTNFSIENNISAVFSIRFILVTALFFFLAWGTGERPRWRWDIRK